MSGFPTPDLAKVAPPGGQKEDSCGGISGRQHVPECRGYNEVYAVSNPRARAMTETWKIRICTQCGEELARFIPLPRLQQVGLQAVPDWVV